MDQHADKSGPDLTFTFEKPEPAAMEQAEKLLREFVLFERRGDATNSKRIFDQLMEVAPGHPEVIFVNAQSLLKSRKRKAVLAMLKAGLEIHPKHPKLEEMYAEQVLIASGKDFATLKQTDLEVMASAKTATIFSSIVPGLGQIVLGEITLGASILITWLIAMIWMFSIPNGLSGIPSLIGLGKSSATNFNGSVFIPIFIGICAWLYATTDASSRAKRATPKTIERPKPPVDKEF